ncbi:MAG: 3'-5' exonuclease [Kiritimatiellia bacterium]|nr:3'-5' exonuclease [Kiritimatiellia bacterium]MDP7022948.1 3'-5' exonuclease [Kiritimatiellia bacterium]
MNQKRATSRNGGEPFPCDVADIRRPVSLRSAVPQETEISASHDARSWGSKAAALRLTWILGVLLVLCALPASAAPIPKALRQTTFVAFDVETTGLSAAKDRVIEIGAVKVRAGRIIGRQVWLINPGRPIPYATTRVHGLTDEDVAEAPSFRDVYSEFVAFVKGAILVAHNAGFDVRFMAHEAQRNDLPFPPEPVLDNLRLARKWWPELESHSLKPVAEHLKIESGRYHRALDDSGALAKVFTIGLRQMPADTTVSNLLEAAGSPLYIKGAIPLDGAGTKTAR